MRPFWDLCVLRISWHPLRGEGWTFASLVIFRCSDSKQTQPCSTLPSAEDDAVAQIFSELEEACGYVFETQARRQPSRSVEDKRGRLCRVLSA